MKPWTVLVGRPLNKLFTVTASSYDEASKLGLAAAESFCKQHHIDSHGLHVITAVKSGPIYKEA